jgi:hypothetical protein
MELFLPFAIYLHGVVLCPLKPKVAEVTNNSARTTRKTSTSPLQISSGKRCLRK